MPIAAFISQQLPERQKVLTEIHGIITKGDPSVEATVGPMMGKEMILYHAPGTFKYGLSSLKEHISLHLLPMYCSPALHTKYSTLLPKVKFQKGCINFKKAEDLPLNILKQLIKDCSTVDLLKIREDYKKSKKS